MQKRYNPGPVFIFMRLYMVKELQELLTDWMLAARLRLRLGSAWFPTGNPLNSADYAHGTKSVHSARAAL